MKKLSPHSAVEDDSPSRVPARILGIDPGLNVTGYAILEAAPLRPRICEAGVVPGRNGTGYAILEAAPLRPRICEAGVVRSAVGRSTADMADRLSALYDGIVEIVEQFEPGVVVVEQLYAHYEHPRTAILMAHA